MQREEYREEERRKKSERVEKEKISGKSEREGRMTCCEVNAAQRSHNMKIEKEGAGFPAFLEFSFTCC